MNNLSMAAEFGPRFALTQDNRMPAKGHLVTECLSVQENANDYEFC
jgi:hypothetical protein